MKLPLFLLFGGQSVDGSGPGVFERWTFDQDDARAFLLEHEEDPYSTARVELYVTGKQPLRLTSDRFDHAVREYTT